MASIGSRSDALRAGYHPKNTPVIVHTRKDRATDHACMDMGNRKRILTTREESYAKNNTDESSCNAYEYGFDQEIRAKISRPLAPILIRSPISFAVALRYRNIHDVHNPNSSNQKRNSCNTSQQNSHQVGRSSKHAA